VTFEKILDDSAIPVSALVAASKKQSKAASDLLTALQRGEMRSKAQLKLWQALFLWNLILQNI
jgi:hypothetical protein